MRSRPPSRTPRASWCAARSTLPGTCCARTPPAVVSKEVVQPGDRGEGMDAGVGAVVVVVVQPGVDGLAALAGAGIGSGVGPFAQGGLDEALGLAVGPGRVGPGAQMPEAGVGAGVAEIVRAVGRAVVGHDALDGDAVAAEPAERAVEEGAGAGLALVGQDLAVGESGCIVDGDMEDLPAAMAAAAGAITGDAVADALDAAELLGIDVQQLAGAGALVADHGRPGLESSEAAKAETAEHQAIDADVFVNRLPICADDHFHCMCLLTENSLLRAASIADMTSSRNLLLA